MFNRLLSRRSFFFFLLASAAAHTAVYPAWASSIGLDVWNLPTLEREIRTANEFQRDLKVANGEVQQRIAVKETKIGELIAGRTTLVEVTDDFLGMDQDRPGYMTCIRSQYTGRTDREKVARNVIEYARSRIEDESVEASVVARLDAELGCMTSDEPLGSH